MSATPPMPATSEPAIGATAETGEKRPAPDSESTPAPKKPRTEPPQTDEWEHGVAPVKPEFILPKGSRSAPIDDDAAEASRLTEGNTAANAEAAKGKKNRGQNKARKFHYAHDDVKLCQSLVCVPKEGDFESTVCRYAVFGEKMGNAGKRGGRGGKRGGRGGRGGGNKGGEREDTKNGETGSAENGETLAEDKKEEGPKRCELEHNLRTYLAAKRDDVDGICPVFEARGACGNGWKCRWLRSHMKEENGELFLVTDEKKVEEYAAKTAEERKRKLDGLKIKPGENAPQDWEAAIPSGGYDDPFGDVVNNVPMQVKINLRKNQFPLGKSKIFNQWLSETRENDEKKAEHRAAYIEPPLREEEKRKIYIGRETPLLAPLTTTGNLPFRRLCVSMGAAITYSEMAMSHSLLQGHKPEWALLRAHSSELPTFGAQICANKADQAIRATEAITSLFPTSSSRRHGLALVDLNCGCPIDLVYQAGGGSALLDQQNKLAKILKGMAYVSGTTPITCKIRMGTKDSNPTARKLIGRLIEEGDVAAITLHGRSRQQRYSRAANWTYIAEMATMIKDLKKDADAKADTAADKEGREKQSVFFIGNGDCYSHVDYFNAVDNSRVDSVMLARGALIKPWLFEEIEKGQYLDKSSSQRMEMVKDYCRYGLECWGTDEFGVATTRRFLLEWLSFTSRYVPLGILEYLPPRIQDRPPMWKGRDDVETLLGSSNVNDWIKLSETFLGKVPDDFHFLPKHKSSSHDGEAEG